MSHVSLGDVSSKFSDNNNDNVYSAHIDVVNVKFLLRFQWHF